MTNENDGQDVPAAKPRGRPRKPEITAHLAFDPAPVEAEEPEVYFADVREQSIGDPKMGHPMGIWLDPDDAEPKWIEPGAWEYEGPEVVDPKTAMPRNLPVQPLGVDPSGRSYYYFNPLGAIVELKGAAGKGDFELLFTGRNDYLFWLFPRWSKDGILVGWEADQLRQALIKAAGWCGVFDDEESVRGRGFWRDDTGQAVFHAGNAVWFNGEWQKPGRYGRFIYPARPETGRPKKQPKMGDVGQKLLDIYKTWNWDRPELDPMLQLGWIMTAKMGGALYRRPFIWVTGPSGAGKSYLQNFSRCLMHGSLYASSNTTSASIYRRLGKDSIPVLLDEQESKADTTVTDRLLDIMRAAYSGDGLERVNKDGKTVTYQLRSSFMASSIAKPTMETSDENRMALLSINLWTGELGTKSYDENEAWKMGQALTRRAMDWLPRWNALLAMMEAALAGRQGHASRSLDTFAPLAAGYHIALYDDMPTTAQLEDYARLLDPSGLTEMKNKIDDWEKCIRHLLTVAPKSLEHLRKKTIGQLLDVYLKNASDMDVSEVEEGLAAFQIRITWRKKDPVTGHPIAQTKENALLFIANTDPELVSLFQGTAWGGRRGNTGAWNTVLRQAPKHLWADDMTCSKGMTSSRGLVFKLQALADLLRGEESTLPVTVKPVQMGMDLPEGSPFDKYEDFM